MAKNIVLLLSLVALAAVSQAGWVAVGPDGGNVMALALDPQQPATLYALPYEYPDNPRVFRTTSGGESWTSTGRLPDLNVNRLVADPHQSGYVYGMSSSTLWRSTDAGASWTSCNLPTTAQGVAADPLVAGRLFACGYSYTTYPVAVAMVSTDYGQSWNPVVIDPDTGYAYCVAFDPSHAGTAYAGCYPGAVYRTTDAGASWTSVSRGLPANGAVQGLAVNPGNPDIVLAAASDGCYRTSDAGGSWQEVGGMSSAFDVALSPANPALAYCLGYDTAPCLYLSTDSGATWTYQPGNVQQSKGGSLITDPTNGDLVYSPGGAGVMKTPDRGAHWTPANGGIRISTISTISVSPWNRRNVYAECYNNSVFRSVSAGDSWTRCEYFLSCGNICGIGLSPGAEADVMWALEGSG